MRRCSYFPRCGGCQLQDLTYEEQLNTKIDKIKEIFKRNPDRVSRSPRRWYYRNRMDYVVGTGQRVGLRRKGKWYSCIDIKNCYLLSRESNRIKDAFRDFIKEKGIEPWDLRKHTGEIRYIVIREGKFTGERLVTLIATKLHENFSLFFNEIKDHVTSCYIGINDTKTDLSFGKENIHITGEKYIQEKILNNLYLISPNSFFQANPYAAKVLLEQVVELLEPEGDVYDLYCGSGFFTIELAKHAKVTGVECSKESVELFAKNLELNSVNAEIINKPVEELDRIPAQSVVIDPPRAGLHKRALKLLIESLPVKIVYVSCNPKTQKRDIDILLENGYSLKKLFMIDQFPQTRHIETIALLKTK